MNGRGAGRIKAAMVLVLVMGFSACSAPVEEESVVSELLLSTEFEDIPRILRTSVDGPAIYRGKSGPMEPLTNEENAALIAEREQGFDPVQCWVLADRGIDAVHVSGDNPMEYVSVWTKFESDDIILEQIFRFDRPDAPRRVLDHIYAVSRDCQEFVNPGYTGELQVAVSDRTGEIDLADTIAYSDDWGAFRAVSVRGDYVMFLYVQQESTVDVIALTTQAVTKFHAGVEE